MIEFIKKLLHAKEDPFQSKAISKIRGEQIRDGSVFFSHLTEDSILGIKNRISFDPTYSAHLSGHKVDNQVISGSAWTKVIFTNIKENPSWMPYDTVLQQTIIPENGIYLFSAGVTWAPQADGVDNQLALFVNGKKTSIIAEATISVKGSTAVQTMLSGVDFGRLVKGDIVNFYAYTSYNNSTLLGNTLQSRFNILKLV